VYVHSEAGEAILPYVLAYLGEDHLIYSGDYPHWDNEFPRNIKVLRDRGDISETAKRKILRENARRLYRMNPL
jgi:predicted TIM-barrel fold metal-dependent hydrolase